MQVETEVSLLLEESCRVWKFRNDSFRHCAVTLGEVTVMFAFFAVRDCKNVAIILSELVFIHMCLLQESHHEQAPGLSVLCVDTVSISLDHLRFG